MQITNQLNPNECGVCVVNSLVHHFYGFNDKLSVLDKANLGPDGLTIFDFELLCSKFNIYAESYTMDYVEFMEYSWSGYAVCLINKDKSQHYVIIKKNKKMVDIYDSASGHIQQSIESFKNLFFGVLILVSKAKTNIRLKQIGKVDIMKNINVKHLLISLFLQIFIVGLNMLISNYLNVMINDSIQNQLVKNGLIFSCVFLLFFILQELVKWILQLINVRQFKINYQYLCNTYIQSILYKKRNFINKIQTSYLFLTDSCINTIVNFLTQEISSFISSFVLVLFSTILLAYFNSWLLVPQIISCLIALICGYIEYVYNKRLLMQCVRVQNNSSEITSELINKYLDQNINCCSISYLKENIQNNCLQTVGFYTNKFKFNQKLNFIENILQYIIYLIVIIMFSFVLYDKTNINIGQMTYVIALQALCVSSFNNMCSMISKKYEYKKMSEIYNLCTNTSNIELRDGESITSIQKINYQGKDICNGDFITEKVFNVLNLEQDATFFVNDVNINKINTQCYANSLFIVNKDQYLNKKVLLKNLDLKNKNIIAYLQKYKLNLTSSNPLTLDQQIIGWLLLAASLKNMLIIFDESFLSSIHTDLTEVIKNNNFLLIKK